MPALSETFVSRELLGLRARGRTVITASLHRPHPVTNDAALEALAKETLVLYDVKTALAVPVALLLHPMLCCMAAWDAMMADYPSIWRRMKHLLQAIMGIAAGWRLRGRNIGAVHCHMAHAPATVALYVARTLGAKFSFTGHAADLFVDRGALAFKLRNAAFVACISHWHRDFYRQIAPVTAKCLPIVRCSVALPEPSDPGEREIVTVARLVAKKGVDILIEAFAMAAPPDWALRILGDGPERAALERLVAAKGLSNRVVFEKAQPHARCLDAIAAGTIFVLACRTATNGDRDGIPVVLIEAMAAGRPVVAGDLVTIRELVDDGRTGLLSPPNDTNALAEQIARLIDDPALRKSLGAAGRAFVAAEFSDDVNLDRLCAAFDCRAAA